MTTIVETLARVRWSSVLVVAAGLFLSMSIIASRLPASHGSQFHAARRRVLMLLLCLVVTGSVAVAQVTNGTQSLASATMLGGLIVFVPAVGMVGRAIRQRETMRGVARGLAIIASSATASCVLYLLRQ